ncbi:MAG: winged helix-turn-helix domain-containing protein [Gammaproteobacteria bacterium]|nr:winged helix-turn-helix domain-containing protein [Gammaproteobacteria bacterium]
MNHWQLGRIFFDTTRRVLVLEQQQHYLEPRIYDLLLALLAAEQQQLSRDQLIEQVWQGRVVSESAINRAVSLLRKALSQLDASQPYLETLPKVGYRLVVSAVVVAPATLAESPLLDPQTEHKNQQTDGRLPAQVTASLNPQLSTSLPGQTTKETAPQLLADDKNGYSGTPRKTDLMQRSGWWIPLLLLLLLVLNLYWLQHSASQSPQQSSEPKSHPLTPSPQPSQSKPAIQSQLPITAVPIPQTSDNGVESQLSLSRDGQWFSYLQQDGEQSRWFLQKSGQQIVPAAEAVTGDFSNAAANASASELAIGSSHESSIAAFEDGQRLQIVVPEGVLRFTSLSPDRQWLLYELCQQELCQLWQRASPDVVSQQTTTTGEAASSAMKPATTNVTTSVKTTGTTTSTIPSPIQLTTPVSKPLSTLVSKPLSTSLSMTNTNGAQPLLPDRLLLQLPLDSQLQISWQHDSQAFYFRQRPDKTKPYVVSRFELATMAVQQLTLPVTEGGDMALAISADATKLAVAGYLQQAKSVLKIYQRQTMALLAEQEVPFAVTTVTWLNDDQLLFGCAEQICRWSVSTQQMEPLFYTGAMVRSLQWQPSLDSSSSAASSAFGGHLWYATAQQNMSIWRQPRADVTGHWPVPEPVVAGSRIDWMPRVVGEDVVFLSNRQGEQQIWRKVAGQSEQRLEKLPPPAEFVRIARSEDGAELVYSQQGAVYLLDINSGITEQILDDSAKAQVVNFGANKAQLIYSSNQSGDWQLWSFDRQSKRSRQLTTHGGYSGYYWQGELWYSKYHRDGLYRLDTRGQEQHMLSNFDKINWLNWQLLDGEVYFYKPDQGLIQWSIGTPEQAPRLVLPTPTGFMHHYQWTRDALWYVQRATAQGDIYQLVLPANLLISKGLE